MSTKRSFLCLRRGVSKNQYENGKGMAFSLPTQRCFCGVESERADRSLFSAYAEVFPVLGWVYWAICAFLCLRRGVSDVVVALPAKAVFSLLTQRCFHKILEAKDSFPLFSAYAEVFHPSVSISP